MFLNRGSSALLTTKFCQNLQKSAQKQMTRINILKFGGKNLNRYDFFSTESVTNIICYLSRLIWHLFFLLLFVCALFRLNRLRLRFISA